jgi:RNA polymerase sigma factor (sigma-70 family)
VDPSSAELLERYRQGDSSAADAIFARYVERLTAIVRSRMTPALNRRIDPEDAVQSAYRSFFIRARDRKFSLQRSGELWKLLVTITLNKLRRQVAHHRSQKRSIQRDRADFEFEGLSGEPSPLEALAAADELAAFMARLDPLQRQVLQMRLQEQRWDEIAKATGRSPRTVRRVLADIRRIWMGMTGEYQPLTLRESFELAAAPKTQDESFIGPPQIFLDYRDYILERHIGNGAMGKVYRARRKSDGATVAVKMLRKNRWMQPGAAERFFTEARIIETLRHPNIVEVFGVGKTPGGGPFIIMEFVDGQNLATITTTDRPREQQAIEWTIEAATALQHAHQHGIVHCDLKPSNLLRERTGRIVLSDFGLAATRSPTGDYQMWGGTPAYMAPEQLDPVFGKISPATDVFALGLVFCNLLTGRAFLAERPVLEMVADWKSSAAVSDTNLLETGTSLPVIDVLKKCLAVDPIDRFPSAEALADALRRVF